MLPNLSSVVKAFQQTVILRQVITKNINHVPVQSFIDTEIKAVVQVQNPEDLKVEIIDYKLKYILLHSETEMPIDYRIVYKSTSFKIIGTTTDFIKLLENKLNEQRCFTNFGRLC